jgi:hypothetical protein
MKDYRPDFDRDRKTILQGDVTLVPVKTIPKYAVAHNFERSMTELVLAHSETGHNHVIPSTGVTLYMEDDRDEEKFVPVRRDHFWMALEEPTELTHHREEHQHEAQIVEPGYWYVQRQVMGDEMSEAHELQRSRRMMHD